MVVNILEKRNSVVVTLGASVIIVTFVLVGCCELKADVELSGDRGVRRAVAILGVEL